MSDKVLLLPDFTKPFRLEADASKVGVGAVLSQQIGKVWRPVAFFSKHLSKTERRYCTTERELLAIVLAVQYFREYLYGVQFSIFSDHQSLSHLTTSDVPHIRLARLQQYLKAYDYVVEYKSGKKLGNADSLSIMFEEDEDPSPFQNLTQSTTMVNAIKLSQNLHFNRQLFDADLKWFIELKQRAPNLKTWLANDHLAAELNPVRRSLLSQYDKLILIHD